MIVLAYISLCWSAKPFYKGDVWTRFLQMNSVDVGGVKIMEKTILDRLKHGEIKDI